MKAVLLAPSTVTGIFSVNIALAADMEIGVDNVSITRISGDALQGNFKVVGSGKDYMLMYYLADGIMGESEITLTGGVEAEPVRVKYDSIGTVTGTFGAAAYQSDRVVLPITFSEAVVGLTKRNFRLVRVSGDRVEKIASYVYRSDTAHRLELVPRLYGGGSFRVEMVRKVCKVNMVMVRVDISAVVVVYPEGAS